MLSGYEFLGAKDRFLKVATKDAEIQKFTFNQLEIEVVLNKDWGSQSEGFRTRLREDIFARYNVKNQLTARTFSNLPELETGFVSISHAPKLGGYAHSKAPIGFDLEDPQRIKADIVSRVSFPEELTNSPQPDWLWVAKEATFKALRGPRQPQVISAINIRWENFNSPGLMAFTCANLSQFSTVDGSGFVFQIRNHLAGIFCLNA